jgi:hypothetical protein
VIKWQQFYISLFLLSVLSALFGSLQAYGDDPNVDYWWDYGEADEEHATFAPAMDKEITRKTRVEVVTLARHTVFVADEYLQIRYLIRVPFDVRIDEKRLPQGLDLTPFDITGFHFGQRRAVKNDRDMELQELRLTLRLDTSLPYDTYVLPSFDLHYQYDTIVGNSRVPQKDKAATKEILLEKVPVYVRVLQQHNSGFLWDVFPCLLEIHADNSVKFFNLYQKNEADSLMRFKPVYPFVLQGRTRSEFSNGQYRVMRYEFMIVVQDFRNQPFTLTFPKIIWQQEGISPESKNVITPESPVFFIQRITADSSRLNPLKKTIPEPQEARYRLLDVPLQILWAILTFGFFWLSFLFWQHHRQKKKDGKVPWISKTAPPAYDRWLWQNFVLGFQIIKARHRFQRKPGQKNCAYLREMLARRSALRLPVKHKMTVAEVCALTADELAQLGGRKQDISELMQLEHQLESGQYNKLRDTSLEGEK